MVTVSAYSIFPKIEQEKDEPPFKWTGVSLEEVIGGTHRIKAAVYGIEGRQARKVVEQCKWPSIGLCDEAGAGLATAYHRPRFKRIFVQEHGLPIFSPSQIKELYPKPTKYISEATKTDIDALRVRKGQILLTCSGTVGHCTYVRNTLDNLVFSHDVIRIETTEHSGFIYAFLKSAIGFAITNTNNYGAVVGHIEPEHLNQVSVPNPPSIIKLQIHNLIDESFRNRDESNELLDEAQELLRNALRLPRIEELHLQVKCFDSQTKVLNYSISASDLDNRLDGTYHAPIVGILEQHLRENAKELIRLDDERISRLIMLPGRFKRVYVNEGNGIPIFTGKNILELDPSDKKFLSFAQHDQKIKEELTIREGMILITCSGTIGRIVLVPKHWDGWAMTHDVIRQFPFSNEVAGYLFAWLSSPYAEMLISRFGYGATVKHIEKGHISEVMVPILHEAEVEKEISNKVLTANQKRAEAYRLEKEALKVLNEKVLYAE